MASFNSSLERSTNPYVFDNGCRTAYGWDTVKASSFESHQSSVSQKSMTSGSASRITDNNRSTCRLVCNTLETTNDSCVDVSVDLLCWTSRGANGV